MEEGRERMVASEDEVEMALFENPGLQMAWLVVSSDYGGPVHGTEPLLSGLAWEVCSCAVADVLEASFLEFLV